MKACKVRISDAFLFEMIGLPLDHEIINAECERSGEFTITITGTADDIPEVEEGQSIPHAIIVVEKQKARIGMRLSD